MGIAELNLDLTDEQKALRDSSRKFFMEVWRPATIALDKMPGPRRWWLRGPSSGTF